MKFSAHGIRCNGCGNLMTNMLDENTLYCPECDNECYLTEPDPENEQVPLQMISGYGYDSVYGSNGYSIGWNDPEDA